MEIHDLVQGSSEWNQFRLDHHGASEAAAMLGLSKKVKRSELLAMKKTGIAKEFSDWVRENILDYGHEVEALARPIVEDMIGKDLYPVTCSEGMLSASLDGLTMDESEAFEHKQWNTALVASVADGILPEEHMPQCQQILLVTGAQKVKFVVSDGTPENMVSMDVLPDPAWFDRIRAGWKQFDIDLESYVPAEAVQAAIAKPTKDLPALSIQVDGSIKLVSNLDRFGAMLTVFIDNLVMQPSTDQEFADGEAAVKTLQKAQDALEAAEASALAQTASIDEMRRTVTLYVDIAKKARLSLSNAIKLRKDAIRIEIAQEAREAFGQHVDSLNKRIGKPYLVVQSPDFAGSMKGLKTVTSLRNAVDTLMANSKIAANEAADKIEINMNSLRELAKDHIALFADTSVIVLKSNDDLINLINSRISEYKAVKAAEDEALRARIAEEERVKAEAKARAEQAAIAAELAAKVRAEQAAIAEATLQAERDAAQRAHERQLSTDPFLHSRTADSSQEDAQKVFADVIATGTGVSLATENGIKHIPVESIVAPITPPTLTLGKIAARLGFSLTADFLRSIGFVPEDGKGSAKLYHESDWPKICIGLVNHIRAASEQKQAA